MQAKFVLHLLLSENFMRFFFYICRRKDLIYGVDSIRQKQTKIIIFDYVNKDINLVQIKLVDLLLMLRRLRNST